MQARPEKAREYGREALDAALDGHAGTTAVHICFGYAAIIHERPEGYSFLTELADVGCDQISIETAQSNLDDSVLEGLPGKTIILGVLNLDDHAVETPETVADRIRRALPYKGVGELVAAPDCGMKYLPRDLRVRQAAVAGGRRAARARRGLELRQQPRASPRPRRRCPCLVERERAPSGRRGIVVRRATPAAPRRACVGVGLDEDQAASLGDRHRRPRLLERGGVVARPRGDPGARRCAA